MDDEDPFPEGGEDGGRPDSFQDRHTMEILRFSIASNTVRIRSSWISYGLGYGKGKVSGVASAGIAVAVVSVAAFDKDPPAGPMPSVRFISPTVG